MNITETIDRDTTVAFCGRAFGRSEVFVRSIRMGEPGVGYVLSALRLES
jgi:Trk K+ transport system NAD-binding subunit